MNHSIEDLEFLLPQTFTPACPVFTPYLLQGRGRLLRDIRNSCNRVGSGIVIYGERGVGKTSLAKMAASHFREQFYYSASRTDSFDSIAASILTGFPRAQSTLSHNQSRQRSDGAAGPGVLEGGVENSFLNGRLTAHIVAQHLPPTVDLIIIDDFERIDDRASRAAFAELIKKLSDSCIPATVMIVGIAETAEGLLEFHGSLGRHIVPINVPPLTEEALRDIIFRGAAILGVEFDAQAIDMILAHAEATPSFTHLLCEGAIRGLLQAVQQGRKTKYEVTLNEVRSAIDFAMRTKQAGAVVPKTRRLSHPAKAVPELRAD